MSVPPPQNKGEGEKLTYKDGLIFALLQTLGTSFINSLVDAGKYETPLFISTIIILTLLYPSAKIAVKKYNRDFIKRFEPEPDEEETMAQQLSNYLNNDLQEAGERELKKHLQELQEFQSLLALVNEQIKEIQELQEQIEDEESDPDK